MSNIVYRINKGINKPLEFRGLQAQYIGYFAGGLMSTLLVFTILYICGINVYITILLTFCLGGAVFFYTYKLNNKYGQYGYRQKLARKQIPYCIRCKSRKFLFQQ